ncbi:MAG: TerB family tellurite resistance protein [Bacteroidia bacterium]|nr:TerB family tellurite resistance protein [Bacteroidia bacterium]
MAKFAKWIGGGLGWAFFGPIGGLLGFAIGSVIDSTRIHSGRSVSSTTRGDFTVSLMVLIAAVLKADGKVLQSELNFVKSYFLKAFGMEASVEAIQMLRDLIKKDIPVEAVSDQIKTHLDYSSRLQLLHFLFGIADADGEIHRSELNVIGNIARHLGISQKDYDSIKSMFYKQGNIDAAYKILEIDKTATDEDVKKAYRKMALKYHPDKVSYLGEDVQTSAKEKFQKLNEAYEKIKTERGMA